MAEQNKKDRTRLFPEGLRPNKLSFKQIMGKLLLEQNTFMATINGACTALVIAYWYLTKHSLPLFIWFGLMVLHSAIRTLYWRQQVIKSDHELKKIEKELSELNAQLKLGKNGIEGLRDQNKGPANKK